MESMIDGILEILRTGGPMAVWAMVLYLFLSCLKPLAIGGAWCLVIRTILVSGISFMDSFKKTRSKRITLLSKECSGKVLDLLEEARGTFKASLTKQAEDNAEALRDLATGLDKLHEMLSELRSGESSDISGASDGTLQEAESAESSTKTSRSES